MITFVNPLESEETFLKCARLLPENLKRTSTNWEMFAAVDEDLEDVVGVIAYVEELDRYAVRWLFVGNEYRKLGVGSMLIDLLVGYIEGNIVFKPIEVDFDSDAENMKEFFDSLSYFDVHSNNSSYIINADMIKSAKLMQRLMKVADRQTDVHPFLQMGPISRNSFYRLLEEKGLFIVDDKEAFEQNCVEDLSVCKMIRDAVGAAIIVSRLSETQFEITYMYSRKPEYLIEPLTRICKNFMNNYENCEILVNPQNENSFGIFKKLFGESSPSKANYTAEWNYN